MAVNYNDQIKMSASMGSKGSWQVEIASTFLLIKVGFEQNVV